MVMLTSTGEKQSDNLLTPLHIHWQQPCNLVLDRPYFSPSSKLADSNDSDLRPFKLIRNVFELVNCAVVEL